MAMGIDEFKAIGDVMREIRPPERERDRLGQWYITVEALAAKFATLHPRFKREVWLAYIKAE